MATRDQRDQQRAAAPVLPESTYLSGYHGDYLGFVAAQLNNRPRKRLGWRTPAEVLDELFSDQDDPVGVALTG